MPRIESYEQEARERRQARHDRYVEQKTVENIQKKIYKQPANGKNAEEYYKDPFGFKKIK